jgi:hypothetical protein
MTTTTKTIDITGATDRHCYDGEYGPRCKHLDLRRQDRCPWFGYLDNELGPDGRVPIRHPDCLRGEAKC